jgi:hypothetical protein
MPLAFIFSLQEKSLPLITLFAIQRHCTVLGRVSTFLSTLIHTISLSSILLLSSIPCVCVCVCVCVCLHWYTCFRLVDQNISCCAEMLVLILICVRISIRLRAGAPKFIALKFRPPYIKEVGYFLSFSKLSVFDSGNRRCLSLLQNVCTCPHTHQASCTIGTGKRFSLGVKRPECDANDSPPPSSKDWNEWSYTSTPPCVVMAYTGKNFNFYPLTQFPRDANKY